MYVGEVDVEVVSGQKAFRPFSPLDRAHTIAEEVIVDPQSLNFGRGVEPIEIHMIESQSTPVLSEQYEGRAERMLRDSEPCGKTSDEARLAGSKFAR